MMETATAIIEGGVSPYYIDWSTGETTQSIGNLSPGNYSVFIYDDNDCYTEGSFTINEFECPDLSIIVDQTDVMCFGECSGYLEITEVENGNPPYNYEWSNGSGNAVLNDLCPGEYGVTITDLSNCVVSANYTITEPDELIVNASSTDETANNANDGTATCTPTGGVFPYTYLWSNGETTQSIANLSPGAYTVIVTDFNNCAAEETVTVAEFGCQGLVVQSTITQNLCHGDCNGTIAISGVLNGTSPFSYLWANGDTTANRTDLCSGNYAVTVTDANNCSVPKNFTITSPHELKINLNFTNETANGANNGTATANPSGGTVTYQYQWSTGATSQSINGLAPGTYSITLTDANGCVASQEFIILEYVCPEINIVSAIVNAGCYGDCNGSITLTVSNGTAPYTYTWSNGNNTKTNAGLCAGNYIVTITDSKNCSVTGNYTITQPDEIIITVDTIQHVSSGQLGKIEISTNGNYIYNWTGPNNYTSADEDISNLEAGCYKLVVTDTFNNCIKDTLICIEDRTSVQKLDWEKSKVILYPNPTDSEIFIDFSQAQKIGECKINLIDISGQKIESRYRKSGENKLYFDIKHLPAGNYIIQIKTESSIISTKVEVVR
ncbi:MAG: T9SS type A sorting domain-containing protein [Saprospiraceae bacterium]